jgi:branched-chain amino acid transport system permease protein
VTQTVSRKPIAAGRSVIPLRVERGKVSLVELFLFAACLVLILIPFSPSHKDVVVLSFLWAGLALAWNIAGGFAGQISFGHAAFFGIGAYTSTILIVKADISPWVGLWIGAAISGMVGVLLSLICARLRGPFFILSTLAVAEVIRIIALNWAELTGGPEGIAIPPVPSLANMVFATKAEYALLMFVYLIAVYLITKVIDGSRYGYYLRATRDDEDAASAGGINPLFMKVSAMGVSAFFASVGGSLFAQYFLYLDPTHVISPELSFQFALLPALGGLGTAIGPILGAFVIIPISELLRSTFGDSLAGLHLAIYGAVVIVVMLYFPGGNYESLDRLLKRKSGGTS